MNTSNKFLILRLLGITSEAYELQLFEAAYAYLETRYPNMSGEDRAQLVQGRYFWPWWTKQWERRNRILLHNFNYSDHLMVPSDAVRRRANQEYNVIHDPGKQNILINRSIIRSTFEMVCIMEGIMEPANAKAKQTA